MVVFVHNIAFRITFLLVRCIAITTTIARAIIVVRAIVFRAIMRERSSPGVLNIS